MSKGSPRALGLASLLLVAACDHIPYYNESLDWFSWSRYDPEVNAIVDEIPPPGELGTAPMSEHGAPMAGPGAAGDPPPRAAADLRLPGGTPGLAALGTTTTVVATVEPTTSSSSGSSKAGAPLVGIRNSVEPSVTWRSTRGTP